MRSWKRKSYDELPALSISGRPLRSALATVTAAWMFGIFWMSCITGSQMTSFYRLLGFGYLAIGIFTAIPYLATLGQVYAAEYVERTGMRKYHFIHFAILHRLLWLAIAAVPLVLGRGRGAIVAFLVIYGISSVLAHMSTLSWYTWMGDLIPRRIRGRYFANRMLLTIPIQIVTVTIVGLMLDMLMGQTPGPVLGLLDKLGLQELPHRLAELGRTPMRQLYFICAVFALGAVSGTMDICLFFRLREIIPRRPAAPAPGPRHDDAPPSPGSVLLAPVHMVAQSLKDKGFRHYALYAATIAFSQTVCDQFFWLNSREKVGFGNFGSNVLFMVIGTLASMGLARLWGKLIDGWGRRPVLILGTLGTVISPIGWFFMRPGEAFLWERFALGAGSCVIGGGMWAAVGLAQTSILLGFGESKGRGKYMAAAAVVMAIGGAAGGLAGSGIASLFARLPNARMLVGPFEWNNYHMTFLASSLVRASSLLWLIGMPEPGARQVGDMVRDLLINAYANVKTRLSWPLRPVSPHMDDKDKLE